MRTHLIRRNSKKSRTIIGGFGSAASSGGFGATSATGGGFGAAASAGGFGAASTGGALALSGAAKPAAAGGFGAPAAAGAVAGSTSAAPAFGSATAAPSLGVVAGAGVAGGVGGGGEMEAREVQGIVQGWHSDLQAQSQVYMRQMEQMSEWDRVIFRNNESIYGVQQQMGVMARLQVIRSQTHSLRGRKLSPQSFAFIWSESRLTT